MMRHLLVLCGSLLTVTVVAYALTSRSPRADFTYVNPSGIHTLDPARMSWTQDFRVAYNLWEGLTTCDPKSVAPIAGTAEWPPETSADRLTYTFSIREDARWSNGDPVTANDFLRGWRRCLEPGTATDYTFLFTDHIAGAGDYVQWRREAVTTLTTLARRRDGWPIDTQQTRHLLNHPLVGQTLRERFLPSDHQGNSTESATIDWEGLTAKINGTASDWSALYDQVFAEHVAAFDDRFAEVGLTAPDAQTLIVHLTRPCPYLPALAALPMFSPCHVSIERLRERYRDSPITAEGLVVYDPQWTKPNYHRNGYPGLVTNGPYRLSEWVFKRRARLEVNPAYRKADSIRCRTVDMLVYENIDASIMAYEAGDVDFLTSMDVPYDHELARLTHSGERLDFHACPTLATYFLNFNCADPTVDGRPNPFVDPRVRRAFALAVDREAIVGKVLQRGDRVARSFVPAGAIAGYDPPAGLSYDVVAARRLMTEAGYPEGRGCPPVDLLYVAADVRVCQAIARMWEEALGVRVELRCKESKTFAADKANRRYMIARGNWYADYNDPTTFLDCLESNNGNNDSGYQNPRYDRLLAEANQTADAITRAGVLHEAERIIVEEDLPILPILHYGTLIAIKPNVTGLHPNARLYFPFQYVSVER